MHSRIRRNRLVAAGVALALVAGTLLAVGAAAQGRRGPGRIGGVLRHLDLTGEQREAIRGAVRRHRESGQPLRQQLGAARRALRDEVRSGGADEAAIRALAAEVAPLAADAAVRRAALHAEIRDLLTDEQRTQLDELRANARENDRERRERRRERRRGQGSPQADAGGSGRSPV